MKVNAVPGWVQHTQPTDRDSLIALHDFFEHVEKLKSCDGKSLDAMVDFCHQLLEFYKPLEVSLKSSKNHFDWSESVRKSIDAMMIDADIYIENITGRGVGDIMVSFCCCFLCAVSLSL